MSPIWSRFPILKLILKYSKFEHKPDRRASHNDDNAKVTMKKRENFSTISTTSNAAAE